MSSVQKVRVRRATLLGKVDIGLPETSLAAMFVFLKPCYLQCLSQSIRVTQAFWEADSRHAGELSVFLFLEKVNCAFCHIGQKVEKIIKSSTQRRTFGVG